MTDIPYIPEMIESMATTTTPRSASNLPMNGSPGFMPSALSYHQEEGVLQDVLEELDRERHNRAELEAKVRVLEQELHSQRRTNTEGAKASVKDYTTVLTERDGYKEVLDAITQDRPAFSQQVRRYSSLPIHIIRLLEVMPWDSRAQQYLFGLEQVYEWQVYSADKKWQKELRFFPSAFKALKIVVPSPGVKTVTEQSTKNFPFGTGVAPPKQCVLTNLEASAILNIDKGYPLPENDDCNWMWVGSWRIGKNIDTDERGWSYSNEVQILSDLSTYFSDFRIPEKGKPNMVKRRRKWTRLRVLIDYPYASNMTKEYLKLVADKARLDGSVDKLAGQLVELKMGMTQLEASHLAYQERTDARIRELTRELEDRNKMLDLVEHGAGLQLTGNRRQGDSMSTIGSSESSRKENKPTDQVTEIRSAVSQWVSNTVQKRQHATPKKAVEGPPSTTVVSEAQDEEKDGISDNPELASGIEPNQPSEVSAVDTKQQLFESLRDKGAGLFEKWKQKGEQELDNIKHNGGAALPWQRSKDQSIGSNHKRAESSNAINSSSDLNKTNNGGDAITVGVDSNVFVPGARARLQSR